MKSFDVACFIRIDEHLISQLNSTITSHKNIHWSKISMIDFLSFQEGSNRNNRFKEEPDFSFTESSLSILSILDLLLKTVLEILIVGSNNGGDSADLSFRLLVISYHFDKVGMIERLSPTAFFQ